MKKFIYALAFFFVAFLATSNSVMANSEVVETPTTIVTTEVVTEVVDAVAAEDILVIIIETDCCIHIIIVEY